MTVWRYRSLGWPFGGAAACHSSCGQLTTNPPGHLPAKRLTAITLAVPHPLLTKFAEWMPCASDRRQLSNVKRACTRVAPTATTTTRPHLCRCLSPHNPTPHPCSHFAISTTQPSTASTCSTSMTPPRGAGTCTGCTWLLGTRMKDLGPAVAWRPAQACRRAGVRGIGQPSRRHARATQAPPRLCR